MKFLSFLFGILAFLAILGEFFWGINYNPFYFKQNTIYFLFEFFLCGSCAIGFYVASKEESE